MRGVKNNLQYNEYGIFLYFHISIFYWENILRSQDSNNFQVVYVSKKDPLQYCGISRASTASTITDAKGQGHTSRNLETD